VHVVRKRPLLSTVAAPIALAVLLYQLESPARRSREVIETCAVYWHTVDLFWVLIFSVLYVVR
jgi:nitric oxide reductase NorE protein